MLSRTISGSRALLVAGFASGALLGHALFGHALLGQTAFGQTTQRVAAAASSSSAALEFPVVMRQDVVAGKTPVGTRVEAKLSVATFVNGVVIPQEATFSGEVTESVAKSATEASRLALCMDSAQWKNGATPVTLTLARKVYLTSWYYPMVPLPHRELPSDPTDDDSKPRPITVYGGGYPGQRSSSASGPPGSDRDDEKPLHGSHAPASEISKHRILMKNVESTSNHEGAVTLTSRQSNIKLDKATTYVLAAGDLQAAK
jgi:hypothetical protein